MKRDGFCRSLWQDSTEERERGQNRLPVNPKFDVVIAGGGITGITTGLLLQIAGKSVMIAEAQTIGFGTTGGTTAHLNTFLDASYEQIKKDFGAENARLVASALTQAMELIMHNIDSYTIDCGYKMLPAYIYSNDDKQNKALEEIKNSCNDVHIDAKYSADLPVIVEFKKVLMIPGQAQIHPLRYVGALAAEFIRLGGTIAEHSRIVNIEEKESLTITTNKGNTITAGKLIYATHIPPGVNLLHVRCAPWRSYAMAVKLEAAQTYPDALIYDLEDPYHYIRTQEIDDEQFLIVGGEDHKTGHEKNTSDCFSNLEVFVRKHFNIASITNRWSSQYFEPADGLPYIGLMPMSGENIYVATGFGGNGMMHSAIAALTLTDLIVSGKSEFEELFDPGRIKMIAGFSNTIKEAADTVGNLLASLLPVHKFEGADSLATDEAAIVSVDGHKMAVYKDKYGNLHAVHAACTHIKCEVAWNSAEKSWDCPCHGSRFSYDGEVLTGPARKNLQKLNMEKVYEAQTDSAANKH